MENNDKTKNDWLKAGLTSPNNTLGDFKLEGLTPNNTQLLSANEYKEKDFIKSTFVDDKGKFDDKAFSSFYEQQKETYNTFAKEEYDDRILKNANYSQENPFAPKGARRVKNSFKISKIDNPLGSSMGVDMNNSLKASNLSIREIAQTQKVYNSETGKYESFTPNDKGFWGTMFGKDTLVLSTWDTDGEHYDPLSERNITHTKGDLKLNEFGKPQYEKNGNRPLYDKNILSGWDVLSIDGTFANKFDFMDSDGIDKSFGGTVMKTAAKIAPYVIPKVRSVFTPISIGMSLSTEIFPIIGKSGAGLMFGESAKNSDFVNSATYWEGVGKRFAPGVSDEGAASTFNKENVFAMVGDVFGQIAQQRALAKIPSLLGASRAEMRIMEAAKASKSAEQVKAFNDKLKSADNAFDKFNIMRSEFGSNRELANIINKWESFSSKAGKGLGVTYMAAISGASMYDEAKISGLDDRDASAMTIGAMAALGAFMSVNEIGHWTLKGIGLDEAGSFIKNAVKDQAGRISKIAGGKLATGVSAEASSAVKSAWYSKMYNSGKNIMTNALKPMEKGGAFYRGAYNEAMEEMSEEFITDSLKGAYNGAKLLGVTSTEDNASFDIFDDMLARYAMSALGGAIGGGLTGAKDALAGRMYSQLPSSLTNEMVSIVINGKSDAFKSELERQYRNKTLPGNDLLTPVASKIGTSITEDPEEAVYETVTENNNMSQSEFIYRTLLNELEFIEKAIYQEGDLDSLDLAPVYKQREAMMLDLKHSSAIRDDISDLISQLVGVEAEISNIEGGIKDATQVETSANQNEVTRLKLKARPIREELANILNGVNMNKYVGHALFHMNPALSSAYGVKTKNDYAEMLYNKPFNLLTPEELSEVDEGYDDYVKLEKRKASRIGFEKFNRDLKIVGNHSENIKKWANQRRALLENQIATSTYEDEGQEVKLQKVYDLLLSLNSDMDKAVQSPDLNATRTDIPVLNPSGNIFDSYMNLLRSDSYINPELASFLKSFLTKPMRINYMKDEKAITDPNVLVTDIVNSQLNLNHEIPEYFYTNVLSAVNRYLKDNKITYENFNKVITSLNDLEFIPSSDKDSWLNDNLLDEYGDPISILNDKDREKLLNLFKSQFSNIVENISLAYTNGVVKEGTVLQGVALETDFEVAKMIQSAEELSEMINEKSISPFHEMLNELASIDGVEDAGLLFDTISRQYDDLSKADAEQFIINSKIDNSHLKYGASVIKRLQSLLTAATTFEESDIALNKIIGYNSAMNNISVKSEDWEEAPEFDLIDGDTIFRDLYVMDERLKFLTNLSEFNINGTVRESKVIGARALTLYLNSIAPGTENWSILESLDLNLEDLEYLFNSAEQYQDNMLSIESTDEDVIPFDSSDEALANLRLEADKIEQAIYKLFNDPEYTVDARNSLFLKAIENIDLTNMDLNADKTSFTQRTKSINNQQSLLYLFQSATIDTKAFYRDMGGDLTADENDLTKAKVTPFLNQELIVKQLYFSVMSKYKEGLNVYDKLLSKILPTRNANEEDRVESFNNREDLPTLRSTIFLDGVPGSGKTSTAINTLNRMIAKYNLNLATYAPYKEQVDNLNSTLEYTDNLVNKDVGSLDDLFNNILGAELYSSIKQDLQNTSLEVDPNSTITLNAERVKTRMKDNPDLSTRSAGFVMDALNESNLKVAEFLSNFKRININGRVPNVIAIDEATHIQVALLEVLDKAISIHNNNSENAEKVSLILLGDTEQNGATTTRVLEDGSRLEEISNINFTNVISTPKLSQTFRSFYSTVNDNMTRIRAFREQVIETWRSESTQDEKVDNSLELKYLEDSELGLVGFRAEDEFTIDDLKPIFEKATDQVVIITNKLDSPLINLVKSSGYSADQYSILTPNNVQGLERDYVLVDLDSGSGFPINYENRFKFVNEINSVYTALSRAKKGGLITNDSTASIKLSSNSRNVSPFKVELNANNLARYKDLTINSIKNNYAQLEDLPDGFSRETTQINFETPTNTEVETANDIIDTALNSIDTVESNDTRGKVITNAKGESTPTEKVTPTVGADINNTIKGFSLSYMFHERMGVLLDPITNKIANEGDIENYKESNSDLTYIGNLLGYNDLNSLNNNLPSLRNDLKGIKTSLMYLLSSNDNIDFKSYLIKAGVTPKLVGRLPNLIEGWDLKILVKDFDRFDVSNPTGRATTFSGNIAYLVLANPLNNKEYFTLSALPDINNSSLPAFVLEGLGSLYKDKAQQFGKGPALYDYEGSLELASNLVLHNDVSTKPSNFNDFSNNNPHLVISNPFIVSGDLFSSTEAKEVDTWIKDISSTKTNKYNLRGKPFTLVSFNKNISNNTDEMVKHFKQNIRNDDSDEFKAGDTRLVALSPRTRGFAEWFDWNSELGVRYNNGEPGLAKDLAAAENNYIVAKMLARFTVMLSAYNKAKKEITIGSTIAWNTFLPSSVAKPNGKSSKAEDVNARVDVFMSRLQSLVNFAIPASMKMNYLEYIGKVSGFSVSNVNDIDAAIKELYKRENLEISSLQNDFYTDSPKGATTKAIEHFITKRLLGFINNKTSSENDVELIDFDQSATPLNKDEKGSLINMVVALRTALNGGTIKVNGQVAGSYQQGIFGNDQNAKKDFINDLDKVITGTNTTDGYSALFPNGINSNITYRRRNDSNKFTGVMPFNMDIGVNSSELMLNVDVQLPKLWVDFSAINLNGKKISQVVDNTSKSDVYSNLYDEYRQIINELKTQIAHLSSKYKGVITNAASDFNIEHSSMDAFVKALANKGEITDESISNFMTDNEVALQVSAVETLNENLNSTSLLMKQGDKADDFDVDISNFTYVKGFELDGSELKAIEISGSDLVNNYLEVNQIQDAVLANSKEANEILNSNGKFKIRVKNGTTAFYVLENSEKSKIFGKFDLTIVNSPNDNQMPRIESPFEMLHSDSDSIDTSDFKEFQKTVNDMIKDNQESKAIFDNFVNSLEAAIQSDFVEMNNIESVKEMNKAYLEASMLLRSNPEALEALRNFYKDFTNTKKC